MRMCADRVKLSNPTEWGMEFCGCLPVWVNQQDVHVDDPICNVFWESRWAVEDDHEDFVI